MNYVLMNGHGECLEDFTDTGWKSTRDPYFAKVFNSQKEAFQCSLEINRIISAMKMQQLVRKFYFVPYTLGEAFYSRNASDVR